MSVPPFATRVARRALGLGLELFSTCALPAPMAPAMAPDTAFRVTIGLDVGLDVDAEGQEAWPCSYTNDAVTPPPAVRAFFRAR